MAEVVVIDGREFAVGDAVLTHFPRHAVAWKAGRIRRIDARSPWPLSILCSDGTFRACTPREIHSIRENFA